MRRLSIVSLAAVLLGCQPPPPHPVAIDNGAIYHAPSGLFTCQVPALVRPGQTITDNSINGTESVLFADIFGRHTEIRRTTLSDEQAADLTGPNRAKNLADQAARLVPAGGKITATDDPFTDTAGRVAFVYYTSPGVGYGEGAIVFPKYGSLFTIIDRQWPSREGTYSPESPAVVLGRLRSTLGGMTFKP